MKCPFCSFEDTQVKDSRPSDDGSIIKRRRYCTNCNGRFTTFEKIETKEIYVLKKNNERRLFDDQKLKRSILVAIRKRPVSADQIDTIISTITKQLEKSGESEIKSIYIGEMVMSELAKVDQVAYVRYASVYKDFSKAVDFSNFIADITK